MAVAWDDLARNRLDAQAQLIGDVRLDRRIDIGEGADGARNRAGPDFRAGGLQAFAAARELCVMSSQLQSESGRLGVDGMAATDADRVFVLHRTLFEGGHQGVEIGQQKIDGLRKLDR